MNVLVLSLKNNVLYFKCQQNKEDEIRKRLQDLSERKQNEKVKDSLAKRIIGKVAASVKFVNIFFANVLSLHFDFVML